MKRIFADGWMQAFTAIAAISGLVMILLGIRIPGRATTRPAPAVESAPTMPASTGPEPLPPAPPDENAASREEAAARGTPRRWVGAGNIQAEPLDRAAQVRAAAALRAADARAAVAVGAMGRPGPLPIFPIVAKVRGHWVVSTAEGGDVDSPSIGRAIYSAADGDVISIRSGKYAESVLISHKSLTLRGIGDGPSAVLIVGPIAIDHGDVRLENIAVEPADELGPTSAAVYATSAKLSLKGVIARSMGVAVKAGQSQGDPLSVRIASSDLNGAYADLLVRGSARVSLSGDRFFNRRQPIVVWRDTHLTGESCRFASDAASRLFAYEASEISLADSPTAPRIAQTRAAAEMPSDRVQFPDPAARPGVKHLGPGPSFFEQKRK